MAATVPVSEFTRNSGHYRMLAEREAGREWNEKNGVRVNFQHLFSAHLM